VRTWRRLLKGQDGLETIEYAIMSGLVVVGVLLAVTDIGQWVLARLQSLLSILTC
jgi:Flp pilus assembly pilin Flp